MKKTLKNVKKRDKNKKVGKRWIKKRWCFSTHVPSFCLTRHIDITGVFRILQRGVHGTNGPMVNTLVIDIMPPKSFFDDDDDDDSDACLEV